MNKDLEKVVREKSTHLNWIHNRMVEVYGENRNVDFLIKFREIIKGIEKEEQDFKKYLNHIDKGKKE